MNACATCDGRGYVKRFPLDQHGDACPDCFTLDGPPPKRRRAVPFTVGVKGSKGTGLAGRGRRPRHLRLRTRKS